MNDTTLLNDPNVIAFAECLLDVSLKRNLSLLDALKRNLRSRTKLEREAIETVWRNLENNQRQANPPIYFR